jgi:hypothetical protein
MPSLTENLPILLRRRRNAVGTVSSPNCLKTCGPKLNTGMISDGQSRCLYSTSVKCRLQKLVYIAYWNAVSFCSYACHQQCYFTILHTWRLYSLHKSSRALKVSRRGIRQTLSLLNINYCPRNYHMPDQSIRIIEYQKKNIAPKASAFIKCRVQDSWSGLWPFFLYFSLLNKQTSPRRRSRA